MPISSTKDSMLFSTRSPQIFLVGSKVSYKVCAVHLLSRSRKLLLPLRDKQGMENWTSNGHVKRTVVKPSFGIATKLVLRFA